MKRSAGVTMKHHSIQQPTVGGIYRDGSGDSFAVLNIIREEVLLEYASGAITTIHVHKWYLLHPRPALF
jgi:hypothetical protein